RGLAAAVGAKDGHGARPGFYTLRVSGLGVVGHEAPPVSKPCRGFRGAQRPYGRIRTPPALGCSRRARTKARFIARHPADPPRGFPPIRPRVRAATRESRDGEQPSRRACADRRSGSWKGPEGCFPPALADPVLVRQAAL